ncbi:MAG: ATP-binding cassette domain-containing protein [Lentisphaerae bacterium]|jgi:phospholipid/cholesterol/gamma-HCH transport system ATP-binding protein|nr:ATP-binding cassette domain-containing protein [Lentisphaerota bacterium]
MAENNSSQDNSPPPIEVRDLTMAYGERVIIRDMNFVVPAGEIFIVMGGSGCGKSTLLRHLIGLMAPAKGRVYRDGVDFWSLSGVEQDRVKRRSGILFQSGALWSAMTLAENIALPLREFTRYREKEIREICELKLSLVGLAGFGDYYPAAISGGMRKRASLARAMALDPEVLFFDEPSAGLDPLSARRLDELILALRESLGATIVVITHDLASIFAIGSMAIFLDGGSKAITACGRPRELLDTSSDPTLLDFLTRGEHHADRPAARTDGSTKV